MVNTDKLIEYVGKIIKSRDPNSIKEIEIDENIIEYSDVVRHWKLEKNDILTKEYNNINKSDIPNIMGIFSMFYLKDKENFLTVGKFNGKMFHLDIKCPQYSKVLNQVMNSDNSIFILSYWIF